MAKKIKWGEVFEDFLLKTDNFSQVVNRILTMKKMTLKEYTKHRPHSCYMVDIAYDGYYLSEEFNDRIEAWRGYCYLLENHPYLLKND